MNTPMTAIDKEHLSVKLHNQILNWTMLVMPYFGKLPGEPSDTMLLELMYYAENELANATTYRGMEVENVSCMGYDSDKHGVSFKMQVEVYYNPFWIVDAMPDIMADYEFDGEIDCGPEDQRKWPVE